MNLDLINKAKYGMVILNQKIEVDKNELEIITRAADYDGVIFKFKNGDMYLIRVKTKIVYKKFGENWIMQ